jgi:hypothetical protein
MAKLEPQPAPEDSLARLYHMSNTAGAGSTDYVAINSSSVLALCFTLAGLPLLFMSPWWAAVLLVATILAIVGLRQIANSNGTQSGRLVAWIALLAAALPAGGRVGYAIQQWYALRPIEQEVTAAVNEFGSQIVARRYDNAYAMLEPNTIRQYVTLQHFRENFASWQVNLGHDIEAIEGNGLVLTQQDGDILVADTVTVIRFKGIAEPTRAKITLVKTYVGWKVYQWDLFPEPAATRPSRPQ